MAIDSGLRILETTEAFNIFTSKPSQKGLNQQSETIDLKPIIERSTITLLEKSLIISLEVQDGPQIEGCNLANYLQIKARTELSAAH